VVGGHFVSLVENLRFSFTPVPLSIRDDTNLLDIHMFIIRYPLIICADILFYH